MKNSLLSLKKNPVTNVQAVSVTFTLTVEAILTKDNSKCVLRRNCCPNICFSAFFLRTCGEKPQMSSQQLEGVNQVASSCFSSIHNMWKCSAAEDDVPQRFASCTLCFASWLVQRSVNDSSVVTAWLRRTVRNRSTFPGESWWMFVNVLEMY